MIVNQALPKNQPLYSYHAFLFPFEWRYKNDKRELLEDQTDLSVISDLMKREEVAKAWARGEDWVTPKSLVQYNEVAYFYDFVRPILYDNGQDESLQRHYRLRTKAGAPPREYVIATKKKTYRLEIDDITVSFFDTGVGVMSFHLLNKLRRQSAPEDILVINGLGRRVYPPFFVTNIDKIGTQAFFDDNDWKKSLENLKEFGELPNYIAIEEEGTPRKCDDYSSWTDNQNLDREPELVKKILPKPLLDNVRLKPVLDDRMFVVSYYGNDRVSRAVQGQKVSKQSADLSRDWWYRYVFVDPGDRTVQDEQMMASQLQDVTYTRWSGFGAFYGVARYSFVCLTKSMATEAFGKVLTSHTQTLYYKLSLLALVQRASLLRFSEEVAEISKIKRSDKRIASRVSSLYKQYIRFINRIYFREVTAQEQGIELYDMLRKQMRLDGQVKDLDRELQELHQYVLIIDEEQRNEKLDLLSYFAALFVVPGFITSYYGINEFEMGNNWWFISVMCVLSAFLSVLIVREEDAERKKLYVAIGIVMVFALFLFPLLGNFK